MRTLEKIKAIREAVNCTHEEARNALILNYGNIADAIKYIEIKYDRKHKLIVTTIVIILFLGLSLFNTPKYESDRQPSSITLETE